MTKQAPDELFLRFHGRIIDSLGIQMYQSPVAAIAELIANAWDADAKKVDVVLPDSLGNHAVITIADDGIGMTLEQCQNCYLDVGRNRRADEETDHSPGGRPLLGRKGIGKFAGFGIADIVHVKTISQETGECTEFELDLNELRGNKYVETSKFPIPITKKDGPDEERKLGHGTVITLKSLKMSQVRSPEAFARFMGRRFLINQQSDDFLISINDTPLFSDRDPTQFEFDFPNDYRDDEKPDGLEIREGWGIERLDDGREICWRIRFTKTPIEIDEFRGVSVFCGVKIAQTPFFFNLSGGLSGQHGQQYMTGMVKADYLDQLHADIITTERQRINWEHPEARTISNWGETRVKSLLGIWKERRTEGKIRLLKEKMVPFKDRLNNLAPSERKTVERAVQKIASIETLQNEQFFSLGEAILTAWEAGRLHELISNVSNVEQMNEGDLLEVLAEAQVLNALHVAEAVQAKLNLVEGLSERIKKHELENAVRDYISDNPWLLSPKWETFTKETSVKSLVESVAKEVGLDDMKDWRKRVDLVLSSGDQLLIIEFMRPGLTIDRDHLERFQEYVDILCERVEANTALGFNRVSGLLVADNLNRPPGTRALYKRLEESDMHCLEWGQLLGRAKAQWEEFFDILTQRVPDDARVQALRRQHKGNGNADD